MKHKQVELPIIHPLCDTYHHIGGGQATLSENTSVLNWYLNESISMFCDIKFLDGYTTPILYIKNAAYWENPHLEQVFVNSKYINGCANRIICNLLDSGYYVAVGEIDDYYIEGKTWYKTRHFLHDCLITGYDSLEKTFTIFAYDINWKYSQFKIPQKSFEKARKAGYPEAKVFKWYGLKPQSYRLNIDPKRILENIKKDIDPSYTQYSMWGEEKVCGIIVHDYINKYFDKILDGSIPYERIDWRVLRALWDHKKLMLLRIQETERVLGLDAKISERYTKIERSLDSMCLQYAAYCRRRRDSILRSIMSNITQIREEEYKILCSFIDAITKSLVEDAL